MSRRNVRPIDRKAYPESVTDSGADSGAGRVTGTGAERSRMGR